tara:strand:- start:3175 stop:3543 length:369 start_codon:yes stop_codon:yes gene_type:complete
MSRKARLRDEHEPNHIKRLPPKELDTEPELDLVALLDLQSFNGEQLELALREYRIKGIDLLLADIKKTLKKKEEKDALNKYLRMCPSIERLTGHLLNEYPKSKEWFKEYNQKLKLKIPNLKR